MSAPVHEALTALYDEGACFRLKGHQPKGEPHWKPKASRFQHRRATVKEATNHLARSTEQEPRRLGLVLDSVKSFCVDDDGSGIAEQVEAAFGKPYHRHDNPAKPGHSHLLYRYIGDKPARCSGQGWELFTDEDKGIVLWELERFLDDYAGLHRGDVKTEDVNAFFKKLGGKGKGGRPRKVSTRARNRDGALRALLKNIGGVWPVADRDQWLQVGMALRLEYADERKGWEVFDWWSRGGDDGPVPDAYDHRKNRATWRSFKTEGERLTSFATVLRMAEEHDPDFKREFEAGELTELAMAERLVASWEGRYIFITDATSKAGIWAWWNGHRYVEDDAQPRVQQSVRELQNDVLAGGGAKREVAATQTRRFARALEGYGSDMRSSARGYFDAKKGVLNTPAGALDLETFEVQPHEKPERFLKSTAVAPDPAGGCPVWEACLEAWQPEPEVRAFLQRVAGYSLLTDNREHALLFLIGEGGNGKGTFVETLTDVLGDYADAIDKSAFLGGRGNDAHPTALCDMHGLRLAVVSEVEHEATWNETSLKRATGDRRIKARRMHENFYSFDVQALPVVVANHEPALRHADDAMRRRLHMVSFDATFTRSPAQGELQADEKLGERLAGEYPAILGWMAAGLRSYYDQGLSPPAAVTKRTDEYFTSQDSVAAFLDQKCYLVADGVTPATDLYNHYVDWSQGDGTKQLGGRRFGEEMGTRARRNLGIHRTRTKRGMVYHGVQTYPPIKLVGQPLEKEIEADGIPAAAAQHDAGF